MNLPCKLVISIFLVSLLGVSAGATTYYVSPSGNDDNDGLDSTTAWLSIDNGDLKGLLGPGDTVNILPGTYIPSNSIQLQTHATGALPIVYRRYGTGSVVIDANNESIDILRVEGYHAIIDGLELTNTKDPAIELNADSCIITQCNIHDVDKVGITVTGSYNLMIRNVIANTGDDGIENDGDYNNTYHNTVYYSGDRGIHYKGGVSTGRIFNNISAGNNEGIRGKEEVICGFNLLWLNSSDYTNGILDSAGGISADPLFVDTAANDFSLQLGSPAIDSGLDLGYPFLGIAPDMGAIEFIPPSNQPPLLDSIGPKSVDEGQSLNFGISATDSESTPALSTSSLPPGASFIDNADGTGVFDWTPTYTQSGIYDVTFYATDDSSAVDSEVVIITVNNVNRSPVLAGIADTSVEEGQNLNFGVSASDPEGTIPTLSVESLPSNANFVDNGDGTGTFDFSPDYTQEDIYNVTFIASDGDLADTEVVAITVTPAPVTYIDVLPPSNVVEELTSVQYAAYGYDAGSTFVGDHTDSVAWSTTDPAGSITPGGLYTAGDQLSPPDYFVKAIYQDSIADSSQVTVISTGTLDYIRIEWYDGTPFNDTALTTDDDTTNLYCRGYDSGDSLLGDVSVNWSLIGLDSIGGISPSGGTSTTLQLSKPGSGWVVVFKSPTFSDTTGVITCIAGVLAQLVVSPDTATVGIGDSIQFTAIGRDADSNLTDVGSLDWVAMGRIGNIDPTGLFAASAPGVCSVAVTSSINAMTATSSAIDVESLYLTAIPLGITFVHPNQASSSILSFRIDNYFDSDKVITDVTLRDATRGVGNLAERLSNVDSLSLWIDLDNDSLLTASDSLIKAVEAASEVCSLSLSPLTIASGTGRTFLVSAKVSRFPHDGDSLDVFLLPATDILTSDSTAIDGPDTMNSFGYGIIDGLVSDQLSLTSTELTSMSPGDTVYNVLVIDIPRNGYREDTLQIFSMVNVGTASASDIDSLFLFSDDGNGTWGGRSEETLLGELVFTGSRWIRSGLVVSLTELTTRFHVGAKLSSYPTNGATLTLTIPKNGIEMFSENDGPIDSSLQPVDTIEIQSSEAVSVDVVSVPSLSLIPGEYSGPLTGIELTNGYTNPVTLDSISVSLFAVDPDGASQEQLESQIDSFLVYFNRDGDHSTLGPSDSLLVAGPLTDGVATLEISSFTLPGEGGSVGLSVVVLMDLQNSKNGNLINTGIAESGAVYFDLLATVIGSFPLKNEVNHSINAFPVEGIVVNEIEGATLFGAQTNRLVFDFELPRNGYSTDQLRSLRLINAGTLNDSEALESVRLYSDAMGDGFSPDDVLLGDFVNEGDYWEVANLACPLINSTTRFLVTVDITSGQYEGGTLQFGIPVEGALYWSGATGPDDNVVSNTEAHLVFPSNRVTAISIPAPSLAVLPGSSNNVILTFALYNGYVSQTQSLQTITLTNISRSFSDESFADYEIGQLSLIFDSDHNRTLSNDSLISSGYFSNGRLQLSGLDIQLPPESLSYFFAAVDIPIDGIDSDSLTVSIAGASDFTFTGPVIINGDLPLVSGGYLIIDGSVSAQYESLQLTARTLSPGDTSVTLFSFRPAGNGDQIDTLESVAIVNLKDATSSDISSLKLWLDADGDSIWQSTDSMLGSFTYSAGVWNIGGLAIEVVPGSLPTLFAIGDVALLATSGVAFQGAIPQNGCQFASANDGPHEAPLTTANTFTISSSGLRVSCSSLNKTYSVGQVIEIKLTATNVSAAPMDSVIGLIARVGDTTIVSLDSSASGSIDLSIGESTDFVFYYTANQPGGISWQVRAVAPTIPDSSATIQTDSVVIQYPPANVLVQLVNSIPTAVTKGQTNVFPLIIKIDHPDTLPTAASLCLDSLRLTVEDGYGAPLSASDAFNRMVLATGYTNLSILESVPSQSAVSLVFSEPVIVSPGQKRIFLLLVDIDTAASASTFALALDDASAVSLVDENTLQPVTIDSTVVFPLSTASCRIDDPSQEMAVSYASLLGEIVNYGQEDVPLLQLNLRHPGSTSSSQIQLTGLSFQFLDDSSRAITVSDLFSEIKLTRQQTVIGQLIGIETDTTLINIQLNSPLTLNPGGIDSIKIVASAKYESIITGFSLRISDSTCFVVRDLSSGSLLKAITDTSILVTGSVFPITTGRAELKQAAVAPTVCVLSVLPPSIVGGTDSLELIEYTLQYPVAESYSSIRLSSAQVNVIDTLGRPLDPDRLFDRIGFSVSGGTTTYQPFVQMFGGSVVFNFSDTGLIVNPGDSVVLQLVADIEADAPYDHFVLLATADNALSLSDATDTTRNPGFSPASGCGASFPFVTGITEIFLPAGRPSVESESLPVQIAFPGQAGLTILDGDLKYDSPTAQGDVSIKGIRGQILKRTTAGLFPATGGEVFDAIHLFLDNQLVASDTSLVNDSLLLLLESDHDLVRGANCAMAITCDIKNNASQGNYVIRFADSSFLDIADKNLSNTIYPTLAGQPYPLLTAEISVSAASLEKSFTNYPNPFHASRGEVTTIGFVLADDAHVDIEIFSITGKAVKQVTQDWLRSAGSHQTTWSGVNDVGREVVPGTYFCRITARYGSDRVESYRRKIAVIR